MIQRNGRWRGEADEYVGPRGLEDDRLRAGDSHDVQGTLNAHPQDEYTVAAAFRLPLAQIDIQHWRRYRERLRTPMLTEESIHVFTAVLSAKDSRPRRFATAIAWSQS
jgi:hypothetical protein